MRKFAIVAAVRAGPWATVDFQRGGFSEEESTAVVGALEAAGVDAARAQALATLVPSALEGALLLSRADADVAPLLKVGAALAALAESAR